MGVIALVIVLLSFSGGGNLFSVTGGDNCREELLTDEQGNTIPDLASLQASNPDSPTIEELQELGFTETSEGVVGEVCSVRR